MSQENNANGVSAETAGTQESEAFVSKKAYEDVSKDMHKFKSKTKELEAALNEYQAKMKSIEEQKLAEENRYKELYEKRTAELEAEKSKAVEQQTRFTKSLKIVELKKELGGNIRDEYLVHADVNAIEFNEDGSLNKDSLVTVANKFRAQHGALIPRTENANITGHAASTGVVAPKSVKEMTFAEKVEALKKLKNENI